MEGIDHVHIVQICRSSFIGEIDRMLEREIPHREGFKLGIARIDASLVLMVELGEAGSHFSAAWPRGCDDHQRPGSLYIIITSEAIL